MNPNTLRSHQFRKRERLGRRLVKGVVDREHADDGVIGIKYVVEIDDNADDTLIALGLLTSADCDVTELVDQAVRRLVATALQDALRNVQCFEP